MKTGEELLIDIFRHYSYFVSHSRTEPPFLVAKKGDVRIAVGYFFGDREVVVYDLKRFLAAAKDLVYIGFFYITNTRFEYHARRFARESGIITWERGKLVEELGKVYLTQFEKELTRGEDDMTIPPHPLVSHQPPPWTGDEKTPPHEAEARPSANGNEAWQTNPREFFTPGLSPEEEEAEQEQSVPKSFTERLRSMFNPPPSSREGDVPDQMMDMTRLQPPQGTRHDMSPEADVSGEKEYFIQAKLSADDIYERFGRDAVLELTLQYVPYFCFDYECELYNDQGLREDKKNARIAVNGLTGQCEEWSGDVAVLEENRTGGLKVRGRYRPGDLGSRVQEAIITTNTLERNAHGEHHWITPQADSIHYVYKGVFYFPFYNVALPDKNAIIDATTGADE